MSEDLNVSNQVTVPDEVADEECVARVVFDPLYLQDGKLGRSAFGLRNTERVPNEQYISVNRMSYWDADAAACNVPKLKDNTICGYAKMIVRDIRRISQVINEQNLELDVKPMKRTPESPHAGVFTLLDSKAVTGAITQHVSSVWMYVQNSLLNISEFVKFQEEDTQVS